MPGGGRLIISTRNVDGVPSSLSGELDPGKYVAISVADTGSGMPPRVLARAFEPFFTTKSQGKGTGLGLAQLYGFAKQSGGTARIESQEGVGTTVTLYLPRTEQPARIAPQLAARPFGSTRARLLLVDDDDDVRGVAAAMIEEAGYDVVTADSGAAALDAVERGGIELVITDIVMPGMSGVELARELRERYPGLPLIYASGYADLETFGGDLSTERVVKKPYRVTEIAQAIHETLAPAGSDAKVVPFPSAG